jgi:hypothetical protein
MDSIDDNNNMTSPLLCKDDDEEVANSPVYNVTHPVVLLKEDDEETPTIATATTVEQRNNGKHKVNTNVKEKNGPRKAGDGSVLVVENTLEESTSLLPVETPTNWERGHVQPEKYRDWPYAIIFWIQFLSIAIYGIICFALFTPQQSNDSNTSNNNGGADILDDEVMLLYGSTLPLLLSLCFVFLLTGLLNSQRNIERLIFGSQCLIIASSILVTFTLLYQGLYLGCFLAAVSTVCGIWYLIVIQNRIPFAAANLNSGFHAVKSNKGVIMVGLLHWIVLAGWLVLWCTSLYHAVGMKQVCSSNDDESSCEIQVTRPGWIFPWVFSLFWTVQVIKYTVQTIVAGVSATWYFTPQEASSFCSSAVRSSIQRSLTTSFGSVCFGALLVAVIQFLDWLVKNLRMRRSAESREHGGGAVEALLLCCLDCILSLMEDIVQYFNKWVSRYSVFCMLHASGDR